MKIAFLSDFHLGHAFNNPRERKRWDDSFLQAREAAEKAADVADAFVIAGDVFDRKNPGVEVLARALDVLSVFPDPPLVIHGNHDVRAGDRENILSVLDRAGVVRYIHGKEVDLGGVTVRGVGWVPEEYARKYFEKKVDSADILVIHQSLEGFFPGDSALPLSALPVCEVCVCGHLHWRVEKRAGNTLFLFPGSTVVTQFKDKELTSTKGFYVYDTDKKTYEFVPLDTPRDGFVLEVASTAELEQKLGALLDREFEREPLVKVVVRGNVDRHVLSRFEDRAVIKVFDKYEDTLVEQLEEIKRRYVEGSTVFTKEFTLSVLKELAEEAGLRVGDEFHAFIDALEERDVERAREIVLRGGALDAGGRNKGKGKNILDWAQG